MADKKTTWLIAVKNLPLLSNLYSRWQDEGEFEDIQEYLAVIKKHIPNAYKIEPHPFAIYFQTNDGDLKIILEERGDYIELSSDSGIA